MQNHVAMRWPFRKQVASNKEEARRHYNAKDYKKAEPFLDAMLKENPNDAWALDVLSRLYMNTERHSSAIDLMMRMLSDEKDQKILRQIIRSACACEQVDLAIQFAEEIHWLSGDEDLLFKMYDTFWPNEKCMNFFANTYWNSDFDFPMFLKAEYLFELGDVDAALSVVNNINTSSIPNETTLMIGLKVYESLGLFEMADKILKSYLDSGLNQSQRRSLAKKLRYTKRYEKSLFVARVVLDENPQDEQMLTLVTGVANKAKSPKEVVAAFHVLDSLNEVTLTHAKSYAVAAIELGSASEILNSIKRLASLGSNSHTMYRNSFTKLLEMKAHKEAEELLKLIKTTSIETDLKATHALEQGDPERAISHLEIGLAEDPENISFLIRKGIALEALGRLEDAINQFELILTLNPDHTFAENYRLRCGLKIWPEEKYFNQISETCRKNPDALNHQFARLNYVLSVMKDYEMGLEISQTCLQHHPENQRAHVYQALILSWLGHHDEARTSITKSIRRWPNSNDVFIAASQIEKNAGNSPQQLEYINSMLNLHGLKPVSSSSPDLAITPEYLSTACDHFVQDTRLVSIIMTTYKRDPLLDAAIGSILNQTYQNIELLIVDDCSPDDNFAYLEKLANDDERIRVFKMAENGGTYLAKNFGMTQAKGEFIGFMDSDDYCHAQRIEFQVNSLDERPDAMGVTHDYFRIDECSDVEFRGIGALRMACISLLIRKEVVEQVGFFDSLRVGADTEYIERIEAIFGKDRRLRQRIPSMFMMLHSSSLTGGGPFHISWRSVSGHRLQHHRSFRAWHKKIKAGLVDGYLPRRIFSRPFEVPEAMKSTHHGWQEGMPLFSEMIRRRNHDWWKGKKDMWQKSLSAKLKGREYVEGLGLKVPELYWKGETIEEIPLFETLPPNFVLKPEKGWSSNNVYCMKGGEDILTHQTHTRESIVGALLDDEFVVNNKPAIMIEELLEPEEKQVQDGLPRDFKFYCFGEEIAMVHVALRKSEIHKDQNVHQYYSPEFKIITDRVMKNRQQGQNPIEKPDCWDEMVEVVRIIGKSLGIYMRIDMFPTSRGAVFGEFTPTPHGGNGYSSYADQYLGSFWKGEEGVE
jgi:glycosyltransferase involved in cell wall biosynthesis/Tfp pilus assembly protein PilF